MDDETIIALYWDRSEIAIRESAARYGSYCTRIAYNILWDEEDAKECVNDTWLGAWNSMPPHRPNRLSTFLGKITRNISINRYKSLHAQKRGHGDFEAVLDELIECIPSPSDIQDVVETAELSAKISNFLRTLPQLQCDIFIRRYWFAEPAEVIAKRYDLSSGSVRMSLSRTRKNLKNFLRKEGFIQ